MRRRTLFGSYLFSYLAVLALPLCVLVFFYYPYTERAVIDREASWCSRSIEQLRLSWESFLRYANALPSAIERNQSIRFSAAEDPGYRRYLLANEMRKYSAADDYVFDVFLYMRKDGYLFSKNGNAYSIADFGQPGDGYYFPRWDHAELERDLRGARGSITRPAEEIVAPTNSRHRVISLVRPLSQSIEGNYASVLVLAKEEALLGAMRAAIKERGGRFLLVDPQRRVVASLGGELPASELSSLLARLEPGEGRAIAIEGKPCIAALSVSRPEAWSYLGIFPVSGRLAELRAVQLRTLVLVLALLLVEALIISLSLRKNFYPLKRLAASLSLASATGPAAGRPDKDEIAVILEALDGLESAKGALDERLRAALPKLREAAARDILKGRYSSREELDEALAEYGVRLEHPLLAFAVLRAAGAQGVALAGLEPSFPSGIDGVLFRGEGEALLLCSHEEGSRPKDCLESALSSILSPGEAASVGVGSSSPLVRELRASYARALRAADLSAARGGGVIAFDAAGCARPAAPSYRVNELMSALETAIREGDSRQIDAAARRILSLVEAAGLEPRLARGLYLNAIALVLEGLRDFRGDAEDFASLTSLVFYDRYSIEEMSEILRASSGRLAALAAEEEGDEDRRLDHAAIRDYVESADVGRELCLKAVAERFGMKESTFSYHFRRAMGENFKDYAERRRIEASKALLRDGDESVERIAEIVGFSSAGSSSFIRAFKNAVGMTPRRYRESARALRAAR
jgi:two-component system, response regulator YesN